MMNKLNATQQNLLAIAFFVMVAFALSLNSKAPDVTNINAFEAKALVDSGAIVFDVREKDAFDYRHIQGAISLPLSVLKVAIPIEYANIKSQNIVIYCGDGVTRGPVATDILNKAGYNNAVNLKPGVDGWQNAGYPMVKKSA